MAKKVEKATQSNGSHSDVWICVTCGRTRWYPFWIKRPASGCLYCGGTYAKLALPTAEEASASYHVRLAAEEGNKALDCGSPGESRVHAKLAARHAINLIGNEVPAI